MFYFTTTVFSIQKLRFIVFFDRYPVDRFEILGTEIIRSMFITTKCWKSTFISTTNSLIIIIMWLIPCLALLLIYKKNNNEWVRQVIVPFVKNSSISGY